MVASVAGQADRNYHEIMEKVNVQNHRDELKKFYTQQFTHRIIRAM